MVDSERILTELLETVVKNEDIKEPQFFIKDISTCGANYTSTLHLITVKGRDMKDLQLFAKVACIGEPIRKAMPLDNAYITERFVYQELIKIYENLQNKSNICGSDRLKFPKLYACSDKYLEETVILENLEAQRYTCYDRFKPVTWEYAAAAVGELAKLHALSSAFAEEDPEKFAKVIEERAFMFAGPEEQAEEMLKTSEENSVEMVPEHLKERLRKFISKHYNIENYKKYYVSATRPVLIHGDYRASNLMHRRR
ncbi:hypothetical protein EVAR_85772_1 [Eumeta japonica]|uniref:CHK kinase-like domain-containing protein n=1 Tax=Eumeta variegata TaxID=151549 RepID=A0A4C2A4H9_EUMVA|nr:hypothetical protein EVAR_85772_1 [Eumeta japonica]